MPFLIGWFCAAHLEAQPHSRLVPELRIGSVDSPDDALGPVADIAIGPDGSIFVSQPQQRTVRVYDDTGVYLRTIGGPGAGPGEFASVSRLGIIADALWVSDLVQSRLSVFALDGALIDAITISGPLIPGISSRPTTPGVLLADGSIVNQPLTGRNDIPGFPLVRMNREGDLLETLGYLVHDPPAVIVGESAGRTFVMQLRQVVPQGSLWGTMPDGTVVIVDRRASPDPAGEYTVRGLRAATDTVFSRRYPYRATPIGDSARDSLIAFLIADMPEIPERELQDAMEIPRFEPPVSALVVGRDASIWLRREQLGREVVEWNVLDESGNPVGIVDVPANVRIAEAQRNRVWGVQTDELGVPYVVRFRVEPLF